MNSKGNSFDHNNGALRNGNNLHDHRRPLSDPRGRSCNPGGVIVDSPPLLRPSLDLRDQLKGPYLSDPRGALMGPSSDPRGASMNVNPSNQREPLFNPRTGTSVDPKGPITDHSSYHTKKPPDTSFNDDTTLMGGTYEHHMGRNLSDSTITETPFVLSTDHQRPSFDRTPKGPLFIDRESLHGGDQLGLSHPDNQGTSIGHRGASPLVDGTYEDHKGPHWSGREPSYAHKRSLPDDSGVSFDRNTNRFDDEGHLIDDRGRLLDQRHSKNPLSSIREPVPEYKGTMLEHMRPLSDPKGPSYDPILEHKGASYDPKQRALDHRGPSYDPKELVLEHRGPSYGQDQGALSQEREVPLWNQKDSRTRNTPGHTWDPLNETAVPTSADHKSAPLQNLWEEAMYPNGNNVSSKKRPLSPVVSWSQCGNVTVPMAVGNDPYQELHHDHYLPHQLPLKDECFVVGSCNVHTAGSDYHAKYGTDDRIKKPLDNNVLRRSGKNGMGKKGSVKVSNALKNINSCGVFYFTFGCTKQKAHCVTAVMIITI